MPIDPTSPAASLISTRKITPVELQNRYGIARQTINDLTPGKQVTILAVQTPVRFTPEQFAAILDCLVTQHGVETMQTAFDCTVPDFGENYRNALYLQAHLRAEEKHDDLPLVE